ncbi:hypothetical protein N7533_001624 [Penicillium manginii]|uniref:uncharacterized protein n=1 Tax=Penicillium manginii TaxID=203109 RepID=UPI00254662BC|nr:uncharacterized protein N7533_001624 [Penicillium manginii]KAJ5762943.1 hypothetical protein N7533_001624 [Penicillium manginii]
MVYVSYLAALAALCHLTSAQAGPNTLAQYNPSKRTMSVNATFCILPISKADARTISGHEPLDIPKSVLPSFPDGMHPLIVQAGINNDIRMTALDLVPLQIPTLMQGSLILPYVDVTKDGKTPINAPINNYIGGTDGHDLQALVPAIAAGVSPFEGTNTFPATFTPDDAAVESLPGGIYSINVKPYLLPNTISGPGVYAEAFDMLYTLTQASPYTDHTFHNLLNHPQLLNNGKCQRNQLYFNETFAEPKMAVANVTLYHQILSTPPALIEGQYTDVHCYVANAEQVGDVGESCASAAAKVDPMALQ